MTAARPLVLIPALNEEQSVATVVASARGLGYEVCVVDDGSSDRTSERARDAGAHVLRLPVNVGIGGALRCGFRWALRNGYDTVIQVDADEQHDTAEVRPLLDAMRSTGAEMVIGSRFMSGSGDYEVKRARRVAMAALSRRVARITGVRVFDSSSGFRVIRRPLLDRFASDYPVEYLDSVEALVDAGHTGAKIVEQPVAMSQRTAGEASSGTLTSIWHVVRVLIAMELMHKRRPRGPARLSGSGE